MKTSELTGAALDWAVAKCEGVSADTLESYIDGMREADDGNYSTNWALGGPIIHDMGEGGLILMRATARSLGWRASLDFPNRFCFGPTPLIAAMRCYVTSKLGVEIKLPKELQ